METRKKANKQISIGDWRRTEKQMAPRARGKSGDRRSSGDRRAGWGKDEEHLLRGTLAATASIVFQLSRPFTIIIGYIDLLLNTTKEKKTKQKLAIIKEQLEIISGILDDFREVDNFTTKKFDGMEILTTGKLLEEDEEPPKAARKKR
jgi:signal transduction histidine kinase